MKTSTLVIVGGVVAIGGVLLYIANEANSAANAASNSAGGFFSNLGSSLGETLGIGTVGAGALAFLFLL